MAGTDMGPAEEPVEADPCVQRFATLFPECAWLLDYPEGKQLLNSICISKKIPSTTSVEELREKVPELLRKVLQARKAEVGMGVMTKEERMKWRMDRIILYDNLLQFLLYDEGNDDLRNWIRDHGKVAHLESFNKDSLKEVDELWIPKLNSNRDMFQSLLDEIYEYDLEIMLKYYSSVRHDFRMSLRGEHHCLAESVRRHSCILLQPIIEIMEGNTNNPPGTQDAAYKKFKSIFVNKTRRYKVLTYWLLSGKIHAHIIEGRLTYVRNPGFTGPINDLFQRVILEENANMMLEEDDHDEFQLDHRCTAPKSKEDVKLGILKFSSVLAIASAVNDYVVVKTILESRAKYEESAECDIRWKASWKKTWATALWNAAYKGHEKVVKELLKCSELYSADHYFDCKMQPPLHVAVHREHSLVVDAFCGADQLNISCHEEDETTFLTPLELTTVNLKVPEANLKLRRIQTFLLRRDEVKQAVEESLKRRELTVGSANAIMVGASVLASVTFGGWLQPPLGYHTYYQFTDPLPAPPDSFLSYVDVQGHTTIRVFAIFNSLSFFFAIAAIVAGVETNGCIKDIDDMYLKKTLTALRNKLKWTTGLFIASIAFALIAFSSAGLAVLPPIERYQRDMEITIGLGGFICLVLLIKMLYRMLRSTSIGRTLKQVGDDSVSRMVKKSHTSLFEWKRLPQ